MRARGSLPTAVGFWHGRLLPGLLLLFWMGAIFYTSGRSSLLSLDPAVLDLLLKKGGHFLAYAVLALLALRFASPGGKPNLRAGAASVVFAMAYAILDEFHQSFVPGRHALPWDVLIDAAGALTAVAAVARYASPGERGAPMNRELMPGASREG